MEQKRRKRVAENDRIDYMARRKAEIVADANKVLNVFERLIEAKIAGDVERVAAVKQEVIDEALKEHGF